MIIYNERRLNVTEDRTLFLFENLNLTFEVLSNFRSSIFRRSGIESGMAAKLGQFRQSKAATTSP